MNNQLNNEMYKNNFYMGVNQKWLNDPKNAIPSEYSSWGGFLQLHDEGLKNQIGLVNELCELPEKDLNASQKKIAAVWSASKKRFESWENDSATCDPILKELDYLNKELSTYSIEKLAGYVHYSQMNGVKNVITFDKGEDFANTENTVLDLSICGTSLPTRDYYFDDKYSEQRKMFVDHLNNVKNIVNDAGGNLNDDFASDVLSFETNIAKLSMSPDQSRNFTDYYTDSTLSELCDDRINNLKYYEQKEDHYDEDDKNYKLNDQQISEASLFFENVFNKFDFRRILAENRTTNYTNETDGQISDSAPGIEQLYVYDGDGLRRMLGLVLNNDNFNRYRAFLQYNIISANKAFTTKTLDDEYFDFYSRKMNGTQEQQPENKRGISLINAFCGELMGQVYVQKFFPPSHKKMISQLIMDVRQSMKEAITQNDWFQLSTKEKALEKLELFGVKIGYPNVWKDYSELNINNGDSMYEVSKKVKGWSAEYEFYARLNAPRDHEEWGMTPQTVNAYFHSLHNEIVFPAAILQKPFFMTNVNDVDFDYSEERKLNPKMNEDLVIHAANCGGIIAVIAHEITHGYDDNGRKFDGNGTKVDWWTKEDADMFDNKTTLMTNQTSKYSFDVTKDGESTTYNLNGKLTMGENLADLGGLSLGLRTLNTKLNRKNITSPNEIKSYHRIFFKSFANIWRTNMKDAMKIMRINSDPHAPPEFRGNLVANIDAFYDAFDIVEGDGMYLAPNERLNMW